MLKKSLIGMLFGMVLVLSSCENTSHTNDTNSNTTYSLRDTGPDGGLIFYVDPANAKLLPAGITYLETAPSDQSPAPDPAHYTGVVWSSVINAAIGTTGTAVGTGEANTALIIDQSTTSAAQLCVDLNIDGVNDWFLPSKDEQAKMYLNLQSGTDENGVTYTPVGVFVPYNYWSSSEYNASDAWTTNFYTNDGHQANKHKADDDKNVRCVRMF